MDRGHPIARRLVAVCAWEDGRILLTMIERTAHDMQDQGEAAGERLRWSRCMNMATDCVATDDMMNLYVPNWRLWVEGKEPLH